MERILKKDAENDIITTSHDDGKFEAEVNKRNR
jgi:hypothetical protein